MQQTENGGREAILSRIRSAVAKSAPFHPSEGSGEIFAPITDVFDLFQKECAANITELIVAPTMNAAAASVSEIVAMLPPGKIFVQDAPVLRRFAPDLLRNRNVQWSSEGIPAEDSQAAITLADCLVAATGSVFVSSECGGRGAAVIAPIHIVFATLDQLVPNLDAAFARLRERGAAQRNSMLCLITGSSRTADIEKILVMGAHGPRRLVVALSLAAE